MKLEQHEDKQHFTLSDLGFGDIKAIRDGLKLYGKQGSAQAVKLAAEIEKALAAMDV